MLGEEKVRFDPTKGSWTQHEYISMKLLFAIRPVHIGIFMEQYGSCIIQGGMRGGVCVEVVLWQLQESLSEFVLVTECATDEVTRFVALTAKYLESWLACRDSLKFGDPFLLTLRAPTGFHFGQQQGKINISLKIKDVWNR